MQVESPVRRGSLAERFHRCCGAVATRLPLGLNSIVAPTFLGFVVINGGTFGVDLTLLSMFHAVLGLPVPLAVTAAYVCAFGLSYWLNRTVNFASHAAVGPQLAVYVAVVAANYLAFVLGVSSLLAAMGVDYRLARILAGCCEAGFMYGAMRWLVFRR